MTAITVFLEQRLKLKVNVDKSAVARPWQRKFLGYSMTGHRSCGSRSQAASGLWRKFAKRYAQAEDEIGNGSLRT